jgi:hypothetical protein
VVGTTLVESSKGGRDVCLWVKHSVGAASASCIACATEAAAVCGTASLEYACLQHCCTHLSVLAMAAIRKEV